jgi:hypothetical protein
MTGRHRTRAYSPTANAAKLALAGAAVSLGALALAGPANADPADPMPVPAAPGDTPAPGQPVVEAAGPPPAPGAAPPNFDPTAAVGHVPDDQAHYGSGSGPLGFLRDAWHQAKDPFGSADAAQGAAAPPPGAGPAPALPPGYVSTNAPGSETVMPAGPPPPHPNLPPGYFSKSGPPPPGYFDPPPDTGGVPVLPMTAPAAPGAPGAPAAYVPVHSPPPPPLELPPS